MRKLIPAAIIIGLALMITSCSGTNTKDTAPERIEGGQTKVSAGNAGSSASENNAADNGFYVTYNGVKITLDSEVAPVVKALGKDYVYTENPSCAYVGIDITYDYKSLILYAQEKNGKEIINTVEIRDNAADCGGIKVGQTFDDVKKIYGEPASTEEYGITYRKNGLELQFISDGSGKVIFILYTHETADVD